MSGPLPSRLRRVARTLSDSWRHMLISIPYVWMLLFFLVPFFIVLKISLADMLDTQPPFSALVNWIDDSHISFVLTFDNFKFIASEDIYLRAYLNSLKIAAISTVLCLLLGYPMAYAIARAPANRRNILLLVVILPLWTSFLLRVYAWIGLLDTNGMINRFLVWSHIVSAPIQMLYTPFAVYLGIVYSYLPFMILPLYASLERLDATLDEAAADLGARPWSVFRDVTLPLSMPGIVAGSLLTFIPAVGEYVIPDLLGDARNLMIGRVLFNEFFQNRDWPTASAVAIALLVALVIPIMFFQAAQAREEKS
ncbi:MAG: ABC transporter permease subunit [Parvibaculaceae bacterium]|nr:ABC transporter permease subunit [Parvibaculaceae bacterium]